MLCGNAVILLFPCFDAFRVVVDAKQFTAENMVVKWVQKIILQIVEIWVLIVMIWVFGRGFLTIVHGVEMSRFFGFFLFVIVKLSLFS